MIRHRVGMKADGTVEYRYELTEDEVANGYVAFASGPVGGTIEVDGVEYDVTPDHVAVKAEHADELAYRIHRFHHAHGQFLETPLPGDGSLDAYRAAMAESRVDLTAPPTDAPE